MNLKEVKMINKLKTNQIAIKLNTQAKSTQHHNNNNRDSKDLQMELLQIHSLKQKQRKFKTSQKTLKIYQKKFWSLKKKSLTKRLLMKLKNKKRLRNSQVLWEIRTLITLLIHCLWQLTWTIWFKFSQIS